MFGQGLSFLAISLTWKHLVPAGSRSDAGNVGTEQNVQKKETDDRKIIPPEIKVNNAFIEEEEEGEDTDNPISDEDDVNSEKDQEDNSESIKEFGRKIITYD